MDTFIRKVNQKINLPDAACPDFSFLKDGCLKTRPIKKVSNLFKNIVLQIQL